MYDLDNQIPMEYATEKPVCPITRNGNAPRIEVLCRARNATT